jgi:hypothetical protein
MKMKKKPPPRFEGWIKKSNSKTNVSASTLAMHVLLLHKPTSSRSTIKLTALQEKNPKEMRGGPVDFEYWQELLPSVVSITTTQAAFGQ